MANTDKAKNLMTVIAVGAILLGIIAIILSVPQTGIPKETIIFIVVLSVPLLLILANQWLPKLLILICQWFCKRAFSGNSKAQKTLAFLIWATSSTFKLHLGLSSTDDIQAVYWWREAAKQGSVEAQLNLALAYFTGKGVLQDYEQALTGFNQVAEQAKEGSPNAIISQYYLGTMYKNGEGCAKNTQEAKKWLKTVVAFRNVDVKVNSSRDVEFAFFCLKSANDLLIDIAKNEEQEKAKQELEDVMAMFAHKFRGPLQSIQYNAEHDNLKTVTLQAVQTMAGLLSIFSIIATNAQQLRNKLQQDMQGEGTLVGVLEKALLPAIKQVLTLDNAKKIRQHYLGYAKKTAQVPPTTTRKQWVEDYDLEEQLQAQWEESFSDLIAQPRLEKFVAWVSERFFPLEVTGFNDDAIHFEHYGATESTLIIVLTEILLNAIKYYRSETNEPVKLSWQHRKDFCRITCENPSHRDERRIDKGSKKGHKFLSIIALNLQGEWTEPLPKNPYRVEWHISTELLQPIVWQESKQDSKL